MGGCHHQQILLKYPLGKAGSYWQGFLHYLWFINYPKPVIISGWAEVPPFLQISSNPEREAACLK